MAGPLVRDDESNYVRDHLFMFVSTVDVMLQQSPELNVTWVILASTPSSSTSIMYCDNSIKPLALLLTLRFLVDELAIYDRHRALPSQAII